MVRYSDLLYQLVMKLFNTLLNTSLQGQTKGVDNRPYPCLRSKTCENVVDAALKPRL